MPCRRSNAWTKWLVLLAVIAPPSLARADEVSAAEAGREISFSRDVAPILVKNCLACHGPDDTQGEYQLGSFDRLMKPGQSENPPITPGGLAESYLYELVTSDDEALRMPMDGDPLPAEAVAIIKAWIEGGAKFDGPDAAADLVSLTPRSPHPAAPAVYSRAAPVAALAFSPDGALLAAGGYHEVTIWDTATGALARRVGDVVERVYGLAWSADGRRLAVAGGTPGVSGEVALYDAASGAFERQLTNLADTAFAVAFNPAGDKLAASAGDRSIRVFDVATGAQERLIEDHADWVQSIAWSADGARLVSASRDKTAKLFDAATGESLATYPDHGDAVYCALFSPDGAMIYSCGADKRVHTWGTADGKRIGVFASFSGEIYKLLLAGDRLAACSADRTVRLFAADGKGSDERTLGSHHDNVYAMAYDAATNRLATAGYDGEIRLWNLADGQQTLAWLAAPGLAAAER